ncbi:hypothetical protein [Saccharopolyspora hattusasensis]|uniref:hypothetical protein n=1 Tax=Saccharopolyspora hattusasensis TaxID=1128679 RepID=UPI003D98B865
MGTDLSADTEQVRCLYRERAHLLAALTGLWPSVISYNDPNEPEMPMLYIASPAGQLSYHLHPDDLVPLFKRVPQVPADDIRAGWDGSTKADVHQRLQWIASQRAEG